MRKKPTASTPQFVRILGNLEEFKDNTYARLSKIEQKLDDLMSFKYRILGGSAVLTTIISLAISWLQKG